MVEFLRRKMSRNARVQHIRARSVIAFAMLLFILFNSVAITALLNYPWPLAWTHSLFIWYLNHIPRVFYPEAPEYVALVIAFLSICRKSAMTIVKSRQ